MDKKQIKKIMTEVAAGRMSQKEADNIINNQQKTKSGKKGGVLAKSSSSANIRKRKIKSREVK